MEILIKFYSFPRIRREVEGESVRKFQPLPKRKRKFPPLGQEGAGEIVHNILKNSRPDPDTIIKTT